MRRTAVKILNLGYLAACAVSIWAICTKPIFKATVNLDMTPEQLGERLEPLFASNAKSSPRTSATREGTTNEKSILDYISVERIADAFRDEENPEKSGFHVQVPVSVEAKYAFQLSNKGIIDELVVNNINAVLDNACDSLSGPLSKFVFSITEEFAIDALETAINEQIKNATGTDSPVTAEEVKKIYQNVYDALAGNEDSIPLSDLTDVIINGKDGGTSALTILNKFTRYVYVECDPQPTEEAYSLNPTDYLIKESGSYITTEEYDPTATYYTYVYEVVEPALTAETFAESPEKYFVVEPETGKHLNTETFDPEATYYQRQENPYTEEDLNRIDIEGQMEDALKSVPGLVDNEYYLAEGLTEDLFNVTLESTKYYLSDGSKYLPAKFGESENPLFVKAAEGDSFEPYTGDKSDFNETLVSNTYFVKNGDSYVVAGYPFSTSTEYYTTVATIKDIDSALVALINQYLLKKDEASGGSRAITRAGELTNKKSKEELNAAIREFALKYLPLDRISSVSQKFGQYVPYGLLAILGLVAFPWAILGLVTLIRTMKRRKCWTKPWVVIVLAFPQILFGIVLTYGTPYALEIAAERVEIIKKILDYGISVDLRTLCLVPSFIYFVIIVYSILYAIIAHEVKVEYKLMKRAYLVEKYRRRRERLY